MVEEEKSPSDEPASEPSLSPPGEGSAQEDPASLEPCEPPTDGGPATLLRFLPIGLAALVFLLSLWRYHGALIDDAYISLRYSRNLVEGHGLVFNPGERVEGYTNFAWVLLGALAIGVERLASLDAMTLLMASSCLAALGMLFYTARRLDGAPRPTPSASTWLLATPAFAYWTTTGMESMLFAALFGGAWFLAWQESRQGRWRGSVFLFLLLALTRPEGIAVFGLCHGVIALVELFESRERSWAGLRRPVLRHLLDGGIMAIAYGAYFAWRFSYYGKPFPNTYYAKVTGGSEQWTNGLIGLGTWALGQPIFALALVLPAFALSYGPSRRRLLGYPAVLATWLVTVVYAGYIVSVGGDFMPFFRFFLPLAPMLAWLTAWQLELLASPTPRARTALFTCLVLAQALAPAFGDEPMRALVAHQTTVVGREVGRHFEKHLPEDAVLAVNTAGSLPYEAGRPTIDMLGLTDAAIAQHPIYVISARWAGHRRGWGAYVLDRGPNVVVWYNSAGLAEPHYLGDHQLADDPFFRFFYQLRRVTLPPVDDSRIGSSLLRRFAGDPFEVAPGERSSMPELGLGLERMASPFHHTTIRAEPIRLVYFEKRSDPHQLWPLFDAFETDPGRVDRFLDGAITRWRADPGPAPDPELRARVDTLTDAAASAVRQGRLGEARELLSRAAALNGRARSPVVYQYVANLATLDGDLFLAVQAQREALRLAPSNRLYRSNLRALLTVPFDEFRQSADDRERSGESPGPDSGG